MKHIEFKYSVVLKRYTPALGYIFATLHEMVNQYDWLPTITITSVNDSNHMVGSRHFSDEAVDIRTKNFKDDKEKNQFIQLLSTRLNTNPEALRGDAFTVLFEDANTPNEHIHVQVRKGQTYP